MDDFADKWLLAAFNTKDEDLKSTEFTRGNVNFSSFGFDARSGESLCVRGIESKMRQKSHSRTCD